MLRAVSYTSSFSTSSSSSPSAAALFRKLLPALVKQIRPDLFGNYDHNVRRKNLICTQTLNEFWFALSDIVLGSTYKAGEENHGETLQVQIPLKSKYHLSCALKTDLESGQEILTHISHSIKVPDVLCSKQRITKREACVALIPIYKDLESLCNLFKVEEAWKSFLNTEENVLIFMKLSSKSSNADAGSSGIRGQKKSSPELSPDMERLLQLRVAKRYVYRSSAPVSYFSFSRKDMRQQEVFLTEEVDYYIGNGHVQVKDLDPVEQIAKIGKLRKIIIDYGFNINFQMGLWYKVIMILSGSDEKYSTEQVKERFIVIIPKKFHAQTLMDHLVETIPFANVLHCE